LKNKKILQESLDAGKNNDNDNGTLLDENQLLED
jgi:hypothetical protein